jgi:hypothetical protein
MKELHWLPARTRISFKVLGYVYKSLNGLAPNYLRVLLSPRIRNPRLRQLHDELQLHTPVAAKVVGRQPFGTLMSGGSIHVLSGRWVVGWFLGWWTRLAGYFQVGCKTHWFPSTDFQISGLQEDPDGRGAGPGQQRYRRNRRQHAQPDQATRSYTESEGGKGKRSGTEVLR